MCVIVINGHKIPNENELVENLKTRYPEIKAIVKNINMKNTNVILGQENINLYGNGYIEDILGEYSNKKISNHVLAGYWENWVDNPEMEKSLK